MIVQWNYDISMYKHETYVVTWLKISVVTFALLVESI